MELPRMLVYSAAGYAFVLVYGLNFIASSIAYGLFTMDFLLIAFIVLLPALFFLLYLKREHIEALHGKGPLLLDAALITTAIAAIFVVFFIIPISY
jgi:hypothetical protein